MTERVIITCSMIVRILGDLLPKLAISISCFLIFFCSANGFFDAFGRYLFNSPILGTLERTQVLTALSVFLSWPYIQKNNRHVDIALLYNRFSAGKKRVLDFFISGVTILFWLLLAFGSYLVAKEAERSRELIYVIHWPLYPFKLLCSVLAFFTFLVAVIEFWNAIKGRR